VRASPALWILLLMTTCPTVPAATADDRGLHGAVGLTVQRDDNLFRLADDVTPAAAGVTRDPDDDGSHRGDTVVAPFATLDLTLAFGRQHLGIALTRRETRLQRYGAYDTRTGELRGHWDWQLGNAFDGRLESGDSDQASELRDFLGPRSNVLNLQDQRFNANWRPRPDRRVTLDLQRLRGRNELPERATSDYTVRLKSIEGGWTTRLGTEWTLRWREAEGTYPNRVIVAATPIDNSYHQRDADLGVVLQPGRRTRAELRFGQATRRHDQVPQRDFSGHSGRAALQWEASGALSLSFEVVRDLNALDDYDRLYAISTNHVLGAQLAIAPQWQLAARWSEQRLDFGGDPANVLTQLLGPTPARRDRMQTTRLALTWLPVERVQLALSVERTHRDSTRPGLQFVDMLTGLSSQYSF